MDVTATVAPLCVGRHACNLSAVATRSVLGDKCKKGSQLIVRVACAAPSDAAPMEVGTLAAAGPRPSVGAAAATVWAVVNATVPGGSVGEVHVPVLNTYMGTITESGVPVWQNGTFFPGAAAGVSPGGVDGRFVWFTTRSGKYSFATAG